MPTFVYMTRCDGCGHCVDICPSDIMHIDTTYRRAYNIEPNMCWECYSCVKLAHTTLLTFAVMLTSPHWVTQYVLSVMKRRVLSPGASNRVTAKPI